MLRFSTSRKMAKEGYTISEIYQGGYSTLQPPEGSYGAGGNLGLTTDVRSANILQEVSTKLSSGVKYVDVTAVSPDVFDAMPKQHLKEVNRLAKLTGVDIGMHGPVMDVAGMSQQGFSEVDRESAERKVADALIRGHELNPDGNIAINFHSAEGIPGSQLLPPSEREEEKKFKKMIAVNRETGKMAPLEPETLYFPVREEIKPGVIERVNREKGLRPGESREDIIQRKIVSGEPRTPEQRLETLNNSEWSNSISQLILNKERADQILEENKPLLKDLPIGKIESGQYILSDLDPHQATAFRHYRAAQNYLEDLHLQANNLFSKAYKYGTPHQKNELKKVSMQFKDALDKEPGIFGEAKAMDDLINTMKKPGFTPKMYVPVEEFALEKSSKTFGNAAFESYKKFKDKAPILVIENPPATHALSTGKNIREMVEKSREQFVKKAVEEGMSKSSGESQAEKFIGATWDVGHINMLRKFGYSEQDIIDESKEVAPVLKQIHLSDNFGFEHTELPMGMGNVPIKEIMKNFGKKGFEAKKLIEAGHWWQHFKTPPFQESLEAMGSPIYSMNMAPYWNQASGFTQGYFSGSGQMLPSINYETFGAGFSQLPQELGGQMPGARGGRMSGRPME